MGNTGMRHRFVAGSVALVTAGSLGTGVASAATFNVAGQNVEVPDSVVNEVTDHVNGVIASTGAADAVGTAGLGPVVQDIPVVSNDGQAVLAAASSKVGSPYVYGAAGPSSFDCSGLTSWAYNQVGKSIPRTSSAQFAGGTPVALNALRAGDIVSFYGGGHVGIADGKGNVVHAPTEGDVVKVTPLAYMPADGAVRY